MISVHFQTVRQFSHAEELVAEDRLPLIVEAGHAKFSSRMSGSQLDPFMGKPATGKTFNIEAVDIVRMSKGRIVEHWGVIDTAAMAAQLGL